MIKVERIDCNFNDDIQFTQFMMIFTQDVEKGKGKTEKQTIQSCFAVCGKSEVIENYLLDK